MKSDQGNYYIGQTQNLEDRLKRHNQNRSKSTKSKGTWEIIIKTEVDTRSEAVKLEKKLKNMKNSVKAIKHLEIIQVGSEHPD